MVQLPAAIAGLCWTVLWCLVCKLYPRAERLTTRSYHTYVEIPEMLLHSKRLLKSGSFELPSRFLTPRVHVLSHRKRPNSIERLRVKDRPGLTARLEALNKSEGGLGGLYSISIHSRDCQVLRALSLFRHPVRLTTKPVEVEPRTPMIRNPTCSTPFYSFMVPMQFYDDPPPTPNLTFLASMLYTLALDHQTRQGGPLAVQHRTAHPLNPTYLPIYLPIYV